MSPSTILGVKSGTNLGNVTITAGNGSGTVAVPAYRLPRAVMSVPRINSSQFTTAPQWTIDTSMLTGITSYSWQCTCQMPMFFCTSAAMSATDITNYVDAMDGMHGTEGVMNHSGHSHAQSHFKAIKVVIECDQGTVESLPFMPYMSHGMAEHDRDDAAVLVLVPQIEATHIAVADGAWTNPATWLGGRVPKNGARVLIPCKRVVTYDQHRAYRHDWIRVDGTLNVARDKSTYMLVETFVETRGSTFTCGTPGSRLPSQYRFDMVISDRDYRTDSRRPTDIDLARDPRLLGRGLIGQGTRVMWGAFKDPWIRTEAGGAPMQDDTSLVLARVPVGWAVGDRIAIGGTGTTNVETEVRTITAISGGMVSWAGGLLHDHDHKNPQVTRTDLQPGIANLTRNIRIRSENPSGHAWRRGHTMDMHIDAKADIWEVQHDGLGRTVKAFAANENPTGLITAAGQFRYFEHGTVEGSGVERLVTATARSNVQGRYGVHGHLLGFRKPFIDTYHGCVVTDVVGWGMVHHDCEARMDNNVVHDFAGAGIVSESGNETGEWTGNFVTAGRLKATAEDAKNADGLGKFGDFFRQSYGLAMRSRAIVVNANMVMDCSNGLVFNHRQNSLAKDTTTPGKDLATSTVDIKNLQGIYRAKGGTTGIIKSEDYPIIHANFNETAGYSGSGIYVFKEGPAHGHGLNVNLKGHKAWAFRNSGVMVQYIGHYIISDADCIAAAGTPGSTGINVDANSHNVTVLRPRTERCAIGVGFNVVNSNGIQAVGPQFYNTTNDPRYKLVAHTSVDDTVARQGGSSTPQGNRLRVWATAPAEVEPTTNLPFVLGLVNRNTGVVTGAVTNGLEATTTRWQRDSVSPDVGKPLPAPFDDLAIPYNNTSAQENAAQATAQLAANYAALEGFWTYNGQPHVIFPMYFADGIYGTPAIFWHALQLNTAPPEATNNGTFVLASGRPVVQSANLTVAKGVIGTIDILALASHPQGGMLTLSNSYFAPDKGRISIDGGVVTYQPRLDSLGTDKAFLWVEDGRGHSTRVQLNITITGT